MDKPSASDSAIEPGSLSPESDPSFTANVLAEIDTWSPLVSVREAANRFGGFGFWRPHNSEPFQETVTEGDIMELKRQTAELQKYLVLKERENGEVLKELEATKATVIELYAKLQLQKNEEEEELREEVHCHIKPPCMVLKDLNKAKMNLCKRRVDLAGLRKSVQVLNKQLQEERKALEKTRHRLMHKSLKLISLEEEAQDSTAKKDLENNALRMIYEVQRLTCQAQEFKKAGEKAMAEIEHTREKIKTAKIKLVAARKMKEAARAAEAVAMAAEIKAVTDDAVTISAEEYNTLAVCIRDAVEVARKRVEDAMSRVEEANVSKMEIQKKVDQAAEEVETGKKALEEAVKRVETANATKLEAEEALRNWKSEKGQRRRSSVNNTAKFKSKSKSKRETTTSTRLMDVNGLHLTYDFVLGPSPSSLPVLKPTVSIGQILSKKLLVAEDSDMTNAASQRKKMSLGQMLAKNSNGDGTPSKRSEGKENGKRSATTLKRKNLGFAKIALLLNKESKNKKKNKKIGLNLR